jgi:cell division protein FtsI (penicillin-binding protein 3)
MAGKTGTAAVNYAKDGGSGKYYASSLWVIFRLIILNILVFVVHKPSMNNNYYGADVRDLF